MRARILTAVGVIKPDADIAPSLTGRLVKPSISSTDGSHDRGDAVAATPGVIPASQRDSKIQSNGNTTPVATGSPASVFRTKAEEQVLSHPLLDEIEQLLDRACAEYAAERMGASAAQATSSKTESFMIANSPPASHRAPTAPPKPQLAQSH